MKFLILVSLFLSCQSFAELPHTDYETVAASQSSQALGPSGGAGDVLERLIVVPATTGAGSVSIQDGSTGATSISVFATGTLSNLQPFVITIGARSVNGPWRVTTGANVSVIGVGRFK